MDFLCVQFQFTTKQIKDWIRSKKQEAPIYKVLFGSLLLLLKLCLVVYILIAVSTVLSIPLIDY